MLMCGVGLPRSMVCIISSLQESKMYYEGKKKNHGVGQVPRAPKK